jgi:hypothetical protein
VLHTRCLYGAAVVENFNHEVSSLDVQLLPRFDALDSTFYKLGLRPCLKGARRYLSCAHRINAIHHERGSSGTAREEERPQTLAITTVARQNMMDLGH